MSKKKVSIKPKVEIESVVDPEPLKPIIAEGSFVAIISGPHKGHSGSVRRVAENRAVVVMEIGKAIFTLDQLVLKEIDKGLVV